MPEVILSVLFHRAMTKVENNSLIQFNKLMTYPLERMLTSFQLGMFGNEDYFIANHSFCTLDRV